MNRPSRPKETTAQRRERLEREATEVFRALCDVINDIERLQRPVARKLMEFIEDATFVVDQSETVVYDSGEIDDTDFSLNMLAALDGMRVLIHASHDIEYVGDSNSSVFGPLVRKRLEKQGRLKREEGA